MKSVLNPFFQLNPQGCPSFFVWSELFCFWPFACLFAFSPVAFPSHPSLFHSSPGCPLFFSFLFLLPSPSPFSLFPFLVSFRFCVAPFFFSFFFIFLLFLFFPLFPFTCFCFFPILPFFLCCVFFFNCVSFYFSLLSIFYSLSMLSLEGLTMVLAVHQALTAVPHSALALAPALTLTLPVTIAQAAPPAPGPAVALAHTGPTPSLITLFTSLLPLPCPPLSRRTPLPHPFGLLWTPRSLPPLHTHKQASKQATNQQTDRPTDEPTNQPTNSPPSRKQKVVQWCFEEVNALISIVTHVILWVPFDQHVMQGLPACVSQSVGLFTRQLGK